MRIAILRFYPQTRAGETLFDGQFIKGSSQPSATAYYELKKTVYSPPPSGPKRK